VQGQKAVTSLEPKEGARPAPLAAQGGGSVLPAKPTRHAPATPARLGSPTPQTDPDDGASLVGRNIGGKFLLEAVIGVGGSGTVYRAIQIALDRTVALKVLRPEFARDPHLLERFKREARAASRLDHPNSVRVLDFGQDEELSLYLAMELVQGATLYDLMDREWPLDEARIVRLLSQVLSALAVAHDLGVIHRDLKPENVIIVRGTGDEGETAEQAKVCDFGIARLGTPLRDETGSELPRVTVDGSFVGTPEYMSPEQVRGEPGDARSDIYSVGVVLYHVLAGRVPFEDTNPWGIAFKHTTDVPAPPSSFAPVNSALEAVCLKAMSKRPQDRYATAREMRAALRACLGAEITGVTAVAPVRGARSRTETPTAVVPRRSLRWPLAAAVGTAALLAGWNLRSRTAPPTPSAPPLTAVAPAPILPREAAPVPAATSRDDLAGPGPGPGVEGGGGVEQPPPVISEPKPVRRAPRPAVVAVPTPVPAVEEATPEPEPAPAPAPPAAPPVAAASTAPPAPAPPPPAPVVVTARPVAPPPPDPERAAVAITAVTSTSAIPGSSLRAALARAPIRQCYREALRGQPTAAAMTATLNLRLDITGYVTGASLEGGPVPPGMKACVERGARAMRVRDVDTGEASAAVTLRFTPS
jgi:eukaryotic-like serine/threonine-protein kinase